MKWLLVLLFGVLALPTFASSVDDAVGMAGKGTSQNEIVAWSQNAPRSVVTPSDVRRMRGAGVPDQAVQNLLAKQLPYTAAADPSAAVEYSGPVYSDSYYSGPYYDDWGYDYGPSVGIGIGFGRGYYGRGGGYHGGYYGGGHRGGGYSGGFGGHGHGGRR